MAAARLDGADLGHKRRGAGGEKETALHTACLLMNSCGLTISSRRFCSKNASGIPDFAISETCGASDTVQQFSYDITKGLLLRLPFDKGQHIAALVPVTLQCHCT